jgi:hypothetical protein
MKISEYIADIKITKQHYEDFTAEEQRRFNEKMSLQLYITEVADVEYECYYEKVSYGKFWKDKVAWHEILN